MTLQPVTNLTPFASLSLSCWILQAIPEGQEGNGQDGAQERCGRGAFSGRVFRSLHVVSGGFPGRIKKDRQATWKQTAREGVRTPISFQGSPG